MVRKPVAIRVYHAAPACARQLDRVRHRVIERLKHIQREYTIP